MKRDTLDIGSLTKRVTTEVLIAKISEQLRGSMAQAAQATANKVANAWLRKNHDKLLAAVTRSVHTEGKAAIKIATKTVSKQIRITAREALQNASYR